jgi:DNA-binding NtrC family response regulator
VFRAVVLADGPMLSPDEFPQIAAQIGEGSPAIRPNPPPALTVVPLEIDYSGLESRKSSAFDPFDAQGDIRPLADVEAEMIRMALERYRGRMTVVARKLGIGRSTLYHKLKELGISDTVSGIAAE